MAGVAFPLTRRARSLSYGTPDLRSGYCLGCHECSAPRGVRDNNEPSIRAVLVLWLVESTRHSHWVPSAYFGSDALSALPRVVRRGVTLCGRHSIGLATPEPIERYRWLEKRFGRPMTRHRHMHQLARLLPTMSGHTSSVPVRRDGGTRMSVICETCRLSEYLHSGHLRIT